MFHVHLWVSVVPAADAEVRAGEGAKRESGGCVPSGCAGDRVPAGGLGAKSRRICRINAFCAMLKAFS